MFDDATNPFAAKKRKFHRIVGIIEEINALRIGKRTIRMHSRPIDPRNGLRHKGG